MKIDIFSGFLGAGKTTLIKKLIKQAYAGEKLVLIENEFGEIGIDGGFMKEAGIEITEMNSGCICCSLVGDFSKALNEVHSRFAPDRIIIEPSGVGKLSDVTKAVVKADIPGAEINACTTVVNAKKCKMYMKNFGEFFNNQIENAGCIIMSHTDGIEQEKLAEAVALVRARNQTAEIVTTPLAEVDGKQILAAMEHTNTLKEELEKLKAELADNADDDEHEHHHDHDEHDHHDHDEHEHHHDHDEHEHHHDYDEHEHHHDHDEHEHHDHDEHEHHHDHDEHEHHHDHDGHDHHHEGHHHADEIFDSWGVETSKKFTPEQVKDILEKLDSCEKYGTILRAKGIVAGQDGWIHFDMVPGYTEVRSGTAETTGKLCVIGCKLNAGELKALFGV